MSRYNVLPAIANLFSTEGFSQGGYTGDKIIAKKVGIIGDSSSVNYPTLAIKAAKNRTNQKQPDNINVVKFDFTKLKLVNQDGMATYSAIGSFPGDSRFVNIDVKHILINEDNVDWSQLTYEDQKGLMQQIIRCEMEYFKNRFRDDDHFYKFLTNCFNNISYNEHLYKLFFDHNVKITIYSCLMWEALTHYQRGEDIAFPQEDIIQAIRDTMPKAPTQTEMKKLVIKIAEDVEKRKFYLTDVPLLTPIQNFLSPLSFIADIELNKSGIYINATLPEMGKRPTNFALMFGKKHLAMFELVNKIHYNMYRINQQRYKFKSLKKDLGP